MLNVATSGRIGRCRYRVIVQGKTFYPQAAHSRIAGIWPAWEMAGTPTEDCSAALVVAFETAWQWHLSPERR